MPRSRVCRLPPSPSSLAEAVTPSGTSASAGPRERVAASGAPVRISWMEGIHDLPLQHPDALARRIERFVRQLVR